MSMYLLQEYKDLKLGEIVKIFNLKNTGSAGNSIFRIKRELDKGNYKSEIEEIKEYLKVVKMA